MQGPAVCTGGSGGAQGIYILWRDWKIIPMKRIYETFCTYFKCRGERDALSKGVQKHVELQCFWHTTALQWVKLRERKAHFISSPVTLGKMSRCISFGLNASFKDMTGTISLSWKRYTCLATLKAFITFQDLIKRAPQKQFLPCMKHPLKNLKCPGVGLSRFPMTIHNSSNHTVTASIWKSTEMPAGSTHSIKSNRLGNSILSEKLIFTCFHVTHTLLQILPMIRRPWRSVRDRFLPMFTACDWAKLWMCLEDKNVIFRLKLISSPDCIRAE